MKKTITIIALLLTMVTAAIAQNNKQAVKPSDGVYSFYKEKTTKQPFAVQQNGLYKAGTYLQKSAIADVTSWGLLIAAGAAYSGELFKDRQQSNITGTILGALSVAARVTSIVYKHKSGAQLKLTPTSATLTF